MAAVAVFAVDHEFEFGELFERQSFFLVQALALGHVGFDERFVIERSAGLLLRLLGGELDLNGLQTVWADHYWDSTVDGVVQAGWDVSD